MLNMFTIYHSKQYYALVKHNIISKTVMLNSRRFSAATVLQEQALAVLENDSGGDFPMKLPTWNFMHYMKMKEKVAAVLPLR